MGPQRPVYEVVHKEDKSYREGKPQHERQEKGNSVIKSPPHTKEAGKHEEVTMGEVDQFQNTVNDRIPDSNQSIKRSQR